MKKKWVGSLTNENNRSVLVKTKKRTNYLVTTYYTDLHNNMCCRLVCLS